MYSKVIPKPLQLTTRKIRKPRSNDADGRGSGNNTPGSEDANPFEDRNAQPTWEALAQSPMSIGDSPSYWEATAFSSPPKSSTKIKRWFFRQKNTDVSQESTASSSGLNTPLTAPPHLEPGFSACQSRSVPDLVIEPPKLTLEELAKIDAFYAPTPILPPTPAPRTGKVYPPWSPDIDYRFKPARSTSLRVGNVPVRTADFDRDISRTESLKRLKAGGLDPSDRAEQRTDLLGKTSSSSYPEVPLEQQQLAPRTRPTRRKSADTENWRHKWVYSKDDEETFSNIEDEGPGAVTADIESKDSRPLTPTNSKAAMDPLAESDGLYFTMGESPITNTGQVTLHFVEDPFKRPDSTSGIDMLPSSPCSPTN